MLRGHLLPQYPCELCLTPYKNEASDAVRALRFCSRTCEIAWSELNQKPALTIRGNLVRVAVIEGENFTFPRNPLLALDQVTRRADVFTFVQNPTHSSPVEYDYHEEPENLAILPITSFDTWFHRQIESKVRNRVRKAEKEGVEVREIPFDEELVAGIYDIYNETPIRQGRRFPHYGITREGVRAYAGTFPTRSIFVGAFYEGRLIGFLKMVTDFSGHYACILHILSKMAHRDQAPTNALMAQAVRSCAERGIAQLAYDHYTYGNKRMDGLVEFKRNNGFHQLDLKRYYVPLTTLGHAYVGMGLHRKLACLAPEPLLRGLRSVRSGWWQALSPEPSRRVAHP